MIADRSLHDTLLTDRVRLRRLLRTIEDRERAKQPCDDSRQAFEQLLANSRRRFNERRQSIATIEFDELLPINARRDEIARAIEANPVTIVCGETGSGKSTQLPKICLSLGRGIAGLIGHTQPRRIAARSVAARVAEELNTAPGQLVGHKVRFTDATGPQTLIKLMTDGILLTELKSDRFLDAYDTIIIDEAHERSLNIDFLLGHLHRLLPRRRDLKLIITSATIDADRFAEHFATTRGPAPIVEVSGRGYPVEVRYAPLEPTEDASEPDMVRAAADAAAELCREGLGDLLVFMPTERHIHDAAKALRGRAASLGNPEILPLYARLSVAEQQKVFRPHSQRRIVLATNVAESSLTVPGIRYVIDTGTARISRYSSRTRMQRLPIEAISQASAEQRKGRCGRVGPGICVRLYGEEDFRSRDEYTLPEIQRTNLAAVVLQGLTLGLGDLNEFPFLDPPRSESIRDGYRTLFELGAIDEHDQLTPLGKRMGALPIDPRTARMVLAAHDEHCLHEVLIIVAALEGQDPRDRPADQAQAADGCHQQFAKEDSDFLFFLGLWDAVHKWKSELSRSRFEKACRQNFLSPTRVREWLEIHRQLVELISERGGVFTERAGDPLKIHPRRDDYAAIHKALVAGLLSNVAFRDEGNDYLVGGGGRASVWPGSGVFAKKPKWIVAGEQIETTKRYLRTCARIDPAWIESLGRHLIKRTHHDPHWDGRAGAVMGYERITLFGLPIIPRRRCRYGSVDPERSRQLFIQHALVEGDIQTRGAFLEHNQQLLERLKGWEHKSRLELLRTDDARYEFYDKIIPAELCDTQQFERWRKDIEREDKQRLFMQPSDLLADPSDAVDDAAYPDAIETPAFQLPLTYRHEPGAANDGITLTVPVEGLNQLDRQRVGWLVPGLLDEKVAALIKSLPKAIRTCFVPVPETARRVVERLQFGRGSIHSAVAEVLTQLSGRAVRIDDFRDEKLPDYLQMNVRVVDAQGKTQSQGRDLAAIRSQLGGSNVERQGAIDHAQWRRDKITAWDLESFPVEVDVIRGGVAMKGYPALVDRGDSVSLRLLDLPQRAKQATSAGLRRLYYLAQRRELETQVQWLPNQNQLFLWGSGLGDPSYLREQLALLIAERAFVPHEQFPRDAAEYQKQLNRGKQHITVAVQDVVALVAPLLKGYHEARLLVEPSPPPSYQATLDDLRSQLEQLTSKNFLTLTPWRQLSHYPRYLRGMVMRWDKLRGGRLAQDQQHLSELQPRWRAYLERRARHEEHDLHDPDLDVYRWLFEEWRISLFAQELGTAASASAKRLDKLWDQLRL